MNANFSSQLASCEGSSSLRMTCTGACSNGCWCHAAPRSSCANRLAVENPVKALCPEKFVLHRLNMFLSLLEQALFRADLQSMRREEHQSCRCAPTHAVTASLRGVPQPELIGKVLYSFKRYKAPASPGVVQNSCTSALTPHLGQMQRPALALCV